MGISLALHILCDHWHAHSAACHMCTCFRLQRDSKAEIPFVHVIRYTDCHGNHDADQKMILQRFTESAWDKEEVVNRLPQAIILQRLYNSCKADVVVKFEGCIGIYEGDLLKMIQSTCWQILESGCPLYWAFFSHLWQDLIEDLSMVIQIHSCPSLPERDQ